MPEDESKTTSDSDAEEKIEPTTLVTKAAAAEREEAEKKSEESGDDKASEMYKEEEKTEEKTEEKKEESSTSEKDSEKSEADKSKDSDADKDAEKKSETPEKYDDFDVPEGFVITEERAGVLGEAFKELNLSQADAQKLVTMHSEMLQKDADAAHEAEVAKHNGWIDDIKADKDMGGDKFDASVKSAGVFLDRYNNVALDRALDETGAGNHPEIFKLLVTLGNLMKEGDFTLGNVSGGSNTPKTAADTMFPSMNKE